MEPIDRIRKAHIAIMQHKKACVYAGVLACGKVEVTDEVPTAATNGWDVKYNPDFMKQYMPTDPELRFVVLHEATHKAYRHLHTWQDLHDEDPHLANVAADYFVNLALVDMDAGEGFIRMPKIGIKPDEKYRGWSVRQIFDDLKKEREKGGGDGDGDGGLDTHDWENARDGGEEAKKAAEAQAQEIARAVRQGEMLRQKLAGKGAGMGDGIFGDLLAPKVDWRKALREFIQEMCQGRDESTWRKPNRRFLADDIYMPSMQGITITELVIGFDTSGSVFGGDEMTRFVSELRTIIEQVKPGKVHVIYWDTAVAGHQTFENGQFAVQDLKIKGGGGTDGSVLFDYLTEKRITPQAIVQFTDGYVGDWGRTNIPTLWAVTSNLTAPFGTTIHLDI
jgi:predicted metal-dependent peptidase